MEEREERLEEMSAFFEARLNLYDQHMLGDVANARELYAFTAQALPIKEGCKLLDLGCGTGLELEFYFPLCPTAQVTGIDLSQRMLSRLGEKFPEKDLTLIQGSYFDVPFGENGFDAAVSVESLHHFTKEEKIPLYAKVRAALKEGGYFLLTDYFSLSEEEERRRRGDFAGPEEGPGPGGRSVLPLRHPPHRGPRGGSLGRGGVLPGGDRKPVGPHLRHPGGEVTPDDKKERHLPGIQAGGVFFRGCNSQRENSR